MYSDTMNVYIIYQTEETYKKIDVLNDEHVAFPKPMSCGYCTTSNQSKINSCAGCPKNLENKEK